MPLINSQDVALVMSQKYSGFKNSGTVGGFTPRAKEGYQWPEIYCIALR